MKFIKLWLGEEKPNEKKDLDDWEFLRFSHIEPIQSLEARLSALSSLQDRENTTTEVQGTGKSRENLSQKSEKSKKVYATKRTKNERNISSSRLKSRESDNNFGGKSKDGSWGRKFATLILPNRGRA